MTGEVVKRVGLAFAAVLILSCFTGCYRSSRPERRPFDPTRDPNRYGAKTPLAGDVAQPEEPQRQPVQRLPWEAWQFGTDLTGRGLDRFRIARGDEYLRYGERQLALAEYYKARDEQLLPREREALMLRIASTELALDQAQKAMQLLSEYFSASGQVVEDVDHRFGLVFAYAYGRLNEVDQCLAWFSRINRQTAGRGGLSDAADSGVRLLLRSLPESQFYSLTRTWHTDSFIHSLMGQESRRRASQGSTGEQLFSELWTAQSTVQTAAAAGGSVAIGVLLPLSGRFAALGQNSKNGIALVLEGQTEERFQLLYKDTAGNPAQAAALTKEVAGAGEQAVVLGPLLAEDAEAAVAARDNNTTLIALTKKSHFPTGGGVFRLGPTVESQVLSLLDKCSRSLNITRFAMVFPEDEAGRGYADVFRRMVGRYNLELLFETSYIPGDNNGFVNIAEQLETYPVEAVFLPDSVDAASRFAVSLSRAQREKLLLLGTVRWDDPAALGRSRASLENAIFVSPFFRESRKDFIQQFVQSYRNHYNAEPDFLAAQGFDAATLLLAALKRQRERGVPLADALAGIESYDGLTGRISVGASGEFERVLAVVRLNPQGGMDELPEPRTPVFVRRNNYEPKEGTQTQP